MRCGVRCTFVMIWLRRRSIALPCFRTGGASFLGSEDNTLKVWDVATGAWPLKGDSVRCGVRCTFVMMCLRHQAVQRRDGTPRGTVRLPAGHDQKLPRRVFGNVYQLPFVATGECDPKRRPRNSGRR